MDYHLNWLCAALGTCAPGNAGTCAPRDRARPSPIRNNQEDVDLLLAWECPDGVTRLVLIEAKCTSRFDQSQLFSNAARIAAIREVVGDAAGRIDMRMLLMSPGTGSSSPSDGRSEKNNELGFPWMPLSIEKPNGGFWVVLPRHVNSGRWLKVRSDDEPSIRSMVRS
jgi:hypothetical protein